MFSMKTQYTLRALSVLSRNYGNGPVSLQLIASEEGIPKRFLGTILQEMKTLGLVDSRMGKHGGYLLTQAPDQISLLTIVRNGEQSIGLLDCVREDQPGDCLFCRDPNRCATRHLFLDIREYTLHKLQHTTLHHIQSL
jgi:Rrf2 family protein